MVPVTTTVPVEDTHRPRQQVLVVEDEQIIALDLAQCLEGLGLGVTLAANEAGATAAIRRLKPDLVLMDIGLNNGADGIEVASILRRDTDAALIFLTAHSDHQTIERAAQVEPRGYIVKPFHRKALAAAVQLALYGLKNPHSVPADGAPPAADPDQSASVVRIGQLKIDLARHRSFLGETEIRVTKKEFGILQFLVERIGTPIKPEAILERVWGEQFAHYIQTLRVHIGNLRHKIETPTSGVLIEAVRGVGYRLVESASLV